MPYKKRKIYRRKKPRRKVYKKKGRKYNRIQTSIVRQPGVVVPDRTFVKINYLDSTSSRLASPGNPFGYLRYYSNSIFDPNPLILTAIVPGFKPMMSLYENFRVRGCTIRLTFSNMENFPVLVLVWPTDQDQSGIVNYQYLQEMVGNAFCRYKSLSAKGGIDKATIKMYISFKKLIGTSNVLTSPEYAGNDSSNPSKLMYWNIGSYTLDGSSFTAASIPFECRLTFYTEFFNRRQLTS